MYTKQLQDAGLTADQSLLYELLLKRGTVPASRLAQETPFSRPLVYKLLGELVELSLVKKDEAGGVTRFSAEHPFALRALIDAKRQAAEAAHTSLESIISKMITDFTAQSGQPGVRILEGVRGIEELYDDILNEQSSPIQLLRSYKDTENPELGSLVSQQISEQVKLGIRTTAVTPLTDETHEELSNWDPAHLVTRRLVYLDDFKLPAQILIYANKVGLTAYGSPLMTTIIENEAIAATFKVLFETIWQQAAQSDAEIRAGLANGTLIAPKNQSAQ